MKSGDIVRSVERPGSAGCDADLAVGLRDGGEGTVPLSFPRLFHCPSLALCTALPLPLHGPFLVLPPSRVGQHAAIGIATDRSATTRLKERHLPLPVLQVLAARSSPAVLAEVQGPGGVTVCSSLALAPPVGQDHTKRGPTDVLLIAGAGVPAAEHSRRQRGEAGCCTGKAPSFAVFWPVPCPVSEPGGSACCYWDRYGPQRTHPAQGAPPAFAVLRRVTVHCRRPIPSRSLSVAVRSLTPRAEKRFAATRRRFQLMKAFLR